MTKLWRDENGLTLVEIVVALLLLSVGILTALALLGTGMRVNDVSRDRGQALNFAEQKMEEWKYINNIDTFPNLLESNVPDPLDNRFRANVSKEPLAGKPNLVKIKVQVFWTDSQNITRTVHLESLRPVS